MRVIEKEPGTEVKQEDADGDKEEMETDEAKDVTEVEVESKDEVVVSPPEHPYKDQLSQFEPHTWQFEEKEPEMYSSLEDTNFTMVDTQSLLEEMMLKLKEVKELAIDWEHHRSFDGTICLIQISTRTADFIIDPLILKDELKVLNEVCTDSEVLKVFHGRDVEWLQNHFGIYVINMFDTKQAADLLKEKASKASILKKYCDVELNKDGKGTDWRVRPLSDEMVKYARQESHYLLYIHDVFRNSLLKHGKGTKVVEELYASCTTACSVMWYPEKRVLRSDSYLTSNKGIKGKLNVQQLECFRLLFEWRYKVAQERDESIVYTLPNRLMMRISKTLPKEAQGIIGCCNPVPPLVQENLEDVHKCVLQAIKNVPEVPKEPVNNKKVEKVSQKLATFAKQLQKKKMQGKLGHHASPRGGDRSGLKTMLRGGAWNRGRGVPFGYPLGGSSMRGGPGFRLFHGRGPRHMGPTRMHPYAHPPPRQPLHTDHYYGFGGYNSGGNPYNVPFNPYNHPSAGPDTYY